MIFFLSCQAASCQARICLEQYFYTGGPSDANLVSRASYQCAKGWYGEMRYNYDAARSYSLYGGKTFSGQGKLSWSLTPIAGLVVGGLEGGALGANIALAYKKLFFSTSSQYTFSVDDRNRNFLFTWSELGWQATGHVYAGVALQETRGASADKWEPGVQVGISYKEWTFPVYAFAPTGNNRYFVLGAIWEKKW